MSQPWAEREAPNRYFDPHFRVEAAKVLPGEYFVTDSEMLLVTVLGSCVSCCMRDPFTGVGGMNHFMLPDGECDFGQAARYGAYAMEVLVNELLKRGARRERLEAKVFGGGNVLPGFVSNPVGEKNARFVLEFLATERIAVAAQDLLDRYPRKVYYFQKTGRVMVKNLRTVANDTILERERDYSRKLVATPVAGDVELFS